MHFVPGLAPTEDADLEIEKSETRGPMGRALDGEPLHYSLDVANLGPDAARDLHVLDFLPPDVPFIASSGGVHDSSTNVVSWFPGDLAAGDSLGLAVDAA